MLFTKFVNEKDALVNLKALRLSSGRLIIFTNGCFDIFHSGHARMFDWINDQWGKWNLSIVVGLNSDESVAKLKPGRPINKLNDRAAVLQMIRGVDLVVPFSEPTPLRLIKTLRPRIMVKGADYQFKKVAGASFVQSYGGRIEFAPYFHGISTTEIAQKCQNVSSSPVT